MSEITPATVLSAITLIFLVLNFAFNRGDKGASRIDGLLIKLHDQELSMKDLEARIHSHVGGGYATKGDIAGLRSEIAGFRDMFEPMARQMGLHPVRQ